MYSQLEAMMHSVRKEAAGLEALKAKLKDMDDLKRRNADLKDKLQASEIANSDLHRMLDESDRNAKSQRDDMQHLNDIYNEEREMHLQIQQKFLTQEQELIHLRGEVTFVQREAGKVADLRKGNQKLQGQVAALEKRLEDERLDWLKAKTELEEQLKDREKVKDEVSGHVWNLSEEIKSLRQRLGHAEQTEMSLQETLVASQRSVQQADERTLMAIEDGAARSHRAAKAESDVNESHREMQRETARLEAEILRRDEELQIAQGRLSDLEHGRQHEKASVRAKINELLDALKKARETSVAAETQAAEVRRAADEDHRALAEAEAEVDGLKQSLNTVNNELTSREEDLRRVKMQLGEAMKKAESSNHHFEAMQNQVRDGQAKYWGELQSMKEREAGYVAEIESLTADLEEKRALTRMLETEKSELQRIIHDEQTLATDAQTSMRDEVGRQKTELHTTKQERDEALDKVELLQKQLNDVEKTIKKNEVMYQRALENDRSKIQHEIRVKLGRIQNMEVEKQELLKELEQLMLQISENQKEISKYKVDLEAANRKAHDLELQYTAVLTDKEELVQEVKMASRKEQELRDTATRLDAQFRENISRLETMVKESKKTAAAQVAEISNRVQGALNEAEDARRERDRFADAQRIAQSDADKYRTEVEMLKKSHDDMQLQMARESANTRRELQEARDKMKLMQESKSKTDTETMRVRLDQTRLENETARLKEIIKDHEMKAGATSEEMADLRSELAKIGELYRTSKARVIDFEQKDLRRDKKVEQAMEELARGENQHKMEQRRLRVTISNLETENGELRELVGRVQKESADAKANLIKLQSSTQNTINGLLEELRSTEESLSKERRKSQEQIMDYHSRNNELQTALERTKGSMEEEVAKTKANASDKEHRLMQLESDTQRMRQHLSDRDDRIQELERARQVDRSKTLELKGTVAQQEQSLDAARTELELEQGLRMRLEKKVKELQDMHQAEDEQGRYSAELSAAQNVLESGAGGAIGPRFNRPPSAAGMSDGDGSEMPATMSTEVDDGLSHTPRRVRGVGAHHGNGNGTSPGEEPFMNYSTSGAMYGYEPPIEAGPSASSGAGAVSIAKRRDYDDDILAGEPSPLRQGGSSHADFLAVSSAPTTSAGQESEDATAAAIDRVTAALSDRLARGGSRGRSAGSDSDGRVGLVTELRDTTALAAELGETDFRGNGREVLVDDGGDTEDVASSIQRTQEFLRQRREARGSGNGDNSQAEKMSPRHQESRQPLAERTSPAIKGATFMFDDDKGDTFGSRQSGHLGPTRDAPDLTNRLPFKTQSITLAEAYEDGRRSGQGSLDKDAILFGAPRLSPPQPSKAGAGVAVVAASADHVPSPERLKRHQKASKGKLKKLSISMAEDG